MMMMMMMMMMIGAPYHCSSPKAENVATPLDRGLAGVDMILGRSYKHATAEGGVMRKY